MQTHAQVPQPILFNERLLPKHYPKDIMHYANTRGQDKVMYAGYFPMGLSLDKIFNEMESVPLKEKSCLNF